MVKSATGMHFATDDGCISEAYLSWYEALAKGGVGLVIVGNAFVEYPRHIPQYEKGRMMIYSDNFIPGLTKLAQTIHNYGCPAFVQLVHNYLGSRISKPSAIAAASPLCKGEFPIPEYGDCQELTISEIRDIVDKFAEAAGRAHQAGFDGIEVHACHNDVINSFLSSAWNKRKDLYGFEDLASRSRLLVEIIRAIKENIGRDFPISVKINGAEYGVEKGITLEESQEFARIIQEAGADAINVSAYAHDNLAPLFLPETIFYPDAPKPIPTGLDKLDKGTLAPLAAGIKKVVSIPVIAVGGLDPFIGEKVLREGKADLIAFGRALIADPDLPNKIALGRIEDIAPCTRCSACLASIYQSNPASCRVNAALGKEWKYAIKSAEKKKKILVIGGGPAGMEAARVTALRGHNVLLCEKEHKLGGSVLLAALLKGHEIEGLMRLIRYLKEQVAKSGVKIRLGKEATLGLIEEMKPDVVIIAVGGEPALLKISGVGRINVTQSGNIYRMAKFLMRFIKPNILRLLTKFWIPFGKRVVIIGGTLNGFQLAEFLVKRNRKVTIVETSNQLIPESLVLPWNKLHLLDWLSRKGGCIFTESTCDEITDQGLIITTKEGERRAIQADTVIPVLSLRPNTEILKSIEGRVSEIYPIGDCHEPGLILNAIASGSHIGRLI